MPKFTLLHILDPFTWKHLKLKFISILGNFHLFLFMKKQAFMEDEKIKGKDNPTKGAKLRKQSSNLTKSDLKGNYRKLWTPKLKERQET